MGKWDLFTGIKQSETFEPEVGGQTVQKEGQESTCLEEMKKEKETS